MVVGGGYIGLEAAAVLRQLDCRVTILETRERLLSRVAGEDLSALLPRRASSARVSRYASRPSSPASRAKNDRVCAAVLEDGERIPCDIVVAGIGIVPCHRRR